MPSGTPSTPMRSCAWWRPAAAPELRREPRLLEEHPHEDDVGRALAQHALHHHVALHRADAGAPCEEDLGHATGRQLRQDLIVVRGRSDLGNGAIHGPVHHSPPSSRRRRWRAWHRALQL
jgi:hypothetical protein